MTEDYHWKDYKPQTYLKRLKQEDYLKKIRLGTVIANNKHNQVPRQINIKSLTKRLYTSVLITQYNSFSFQKKKLQGILHGKKKKNTVWREKSSFRTKLRYVGEFWNDYTRNLR